VGKDKTKTSVNTAVRQRSVPLPRTATAAMLTAVALAVLSLFVGSTAVAQEDDGAYVSVSEGELTVEASALAPGAAMTVSGEGFAPDSSLLFVVSNADAGNAILNEEIFADSAGSVTHSFTLPSEMVTADYLARVSGLTADGGSLLLEKVVRIDGNVEQLTTTTIVTTTTVAADPTARTDPGEGAPVSATDDGAPVSATTAAGDTTRPTPTVDQLSDDEPGVAELAAGDDSETAAAATTPSSSSGSTALVVVIVVGMVGALGATGFLLRRRATKPY